MWRRGGVNREDNARWGNDFCFSLTGCLCFFSLVFFLSSSLLSSSELRTVRQFYDGATGVTVPVINFLTREGIILPSPLCSLGEVGEIGQCAHLGQLDV